MTNLFLLRKQWALQTCLIPAGFQSCIQTNSKLCHLSARSPCSSAGVLRCCFLPAVGQKKPSRISPRVEKGDSSSKPMIFEASCNSSGWWFQPNISFQKICASQIWDSFPQKKFGVKMPKIFGLPPPTRSSFQEYYHDSMQFRGFTTVTSERNKYPCFFSPGVMSLGILAHQT